MSHVDVDDIRRQMAMIRREIHADVSNVVSEVEEAMDWRAPIRNHPYIALGAGLLAGYFLVPRKRSNLQRARQALASIPPEALASVAPRASVVHRHEPPKPLGRRILNWSVGMAWPLVSQAAQSYAAMWLEDQIKQQMNPNRIPPAGSAPPSSADRPNGSHDVAAARPAHRG